MKVSPFWAAALLVLSAAAMHAAPAKQMSVVVKVTQVRSTASYLAQVLGTLAYGDRVDVLEVQKDWARVSMASKQLSGWTNVSALTEKKIVMSSGSGNVDQNASSGEVALAGKGFNEQIETQYKSDGKIDYTWVDRMEQMTESPQDVSAFLAAGALGEGGSK